MKKWLQTSSIAALILLLAACASSQFAEVETRGTKPVPPGTPAPPVKSNEARPAPVTPPQASPPVLPTSPVAPSVAKKGGGYYKDDGPGDTPPPDMASVPDAQPKTEPLHRFANRPYVALGQNYVPRQELVPYKESGIASWYGRRFHGARTSSGERYDMYAMTAAHPTLPIPSYVRVTRVESGKSVIVRINDRGPFHNDRVIDLSYTAAWKLGYVTKGSTQVEVESIVPEGETLEAKTAPPPGASIPVAESVAPTPVAITVPAEPSAQVSLAPGVYLQLGAFNSLLNAEGFRDYAKQELSGLKQQLFIIPDADRFRLQLGPFSNPAAAREMAERVNTKLKLKPFLVQR